MLLVVVLAAPPITVHAEGSPALQISELLPNPHNDREFVELYNAGSTPLRLDGWKVTDNAGEFALPSVELTPGATWVVWSGPGALAAAEENQASSAWTTANVWNNGGDTASLVAPDGTTSRELSYGADPAAPPRGSSLARQENGSWEMAEEPTPGAHGARASNGGSPSVADLVAEVLNQPPTIALEAPERGEPNQELSVALTVHDDNGGDDVGEWHLVVSGPEGPLVTRTGIGANRTVVTVTADFIGDLLIEATARDQHDAWSKANRTIRIEAPQFDVETPPGGLQFEGLVPGARDVQTSGALVIRNPGRNEQTPHFDIEPLVDGQGNIIAVDDNLLFILESGQEVAYGGPLTALPALAPGAEHRVILRLAVIPAPLPAGAFSTTFTVVP